VSALWSKVRWNGTVFILQLKYETAEAFTGRVEVCLSGQIWADAGEGGWGGEGESRGRGEGMGDPGSGTNPSEIC